ncbi:MAG: hypothetical protein I3273_05650 [Candidatus Moeniiplasma glomeromycotorum]|nr:hypothetical protein [Candidatus Moeniiplasma glomeromycotorum]MCE8168053.1 hypothetical protein [Candidatus Moeniiplasma glomeromycotorum]MCE8169570.1 hypothetical protein [Candidatus Moeniiplasma glomeromycotorum]
MPKNNILINVQNTKRPMLVAEVQELHTNLTHSPLINYKLGTILRGEYLEKN